MQVHKIESEIARTLKRMTATGAVLKGSISRVTLGKKAHLPGNRVSYLLTYKSDGNKTRSVYLRKDQIPRVKQMIGNYRRLKTTLNQLLELNVKLFKAQQLAERSAIS
jgi:hypothetical protein